MKLKNKNLESFLMLVLNKKVEDINTEDIKTLESISISTSSEEDEHAYGLEELLNFPSIKRLVIIDSYLSDRDFGVLEALNLEEVCFDNCAFGNDMLLLRLSSAKKMEFLQCFHEDFNFLKGLFSLVSIRIRNPQGNSVVPLSKMHDLYNLETLELGLCEVLELGSFSDIAKRLKEISLLGVNLSDLSFIDSLKDGTILYINQEYNVNPIVQSNRERLDIRNDYSMFAFEEDEKNIPL